MPNGSSAASEVAELLSVPLEEILVSLGRGIGAAQSALDRHSIEIQRQIDEDPVLGQYGLQATWYQLPSTQVELKVAVVAQQPAEAQAAPPAQAAAASPAEAVPLPLPVRPLPPIYLQPVNARYANQFSYDVNAASTVTLTIVPVPPPAPVSAGRPALTADAVLAIAAPELILGDDNNPVPRVSISYNGGVRAWYVLQTDETTDPPALVRMARVDDATGAITKQIIPGSS